MQAFVCSVFNPFCFLGLHLISTSETASEKSTVDAWKGQKRRQSICPRNVWKSKPFFPLGEHFLEDCQIIPQKKIPEIWNVFLTHEISKTQQKIPFHEIHEGTLIISHLSSIKPPSTWKSNASKQPKTIGSIGRTVYLPIQSIHEKLIFVVNVGKYTIHGWYGNGKLLNFRKCSWKWICLFPAFWFWKMHKIWQNGAIQWCRECDPFLIASVGDF